MDVTHVPEFERLKYVHVTIDTFSKMIWATALPGERHIMSVNICLLVLLYWECLNKSKQIMGLRTLVKN